MSKELKKWLVSKNMSLIYVGTKFASLLGREVVVTEVDEDLLPMFKTKEEKIDNLDKLEL